MKIKAVFTLLILLLSYIIISPVLGSDDTPSPSGTSADYGIFNSIQELHLEQETRADDPEVLEEVGSTLGSLSPSEYIFKDPGYSGFQEEKLSIPQPLTQSPVVFEALSTNPIVNNTSVLDWLLPPPLSEQGAINYLVMVQSGDHRTWGLGSMVPRLGILVDSSLDKWLYIDVDENPGTGRPDGSDIRARMTFAKDIPRRDWDFSIFPPSVTFHDAGIRIEVEALDITESMLDIGGSIYFIKGISYGEIIGEPKNYIWSVGLGLEKFMDSIVLRLQADQWRSEPAAALINLLSSGGSVNIQDLGLLEILGPYTLSYGFRTAPESMEIFISLMRVFDQVLEDRAYLKLDLDRDQFHERIIDEGALILNIEDFGSPIDLVEWRAGGEVSSIDDTLSLGIRYVEFGDDLVDARLNIPVLPNRVTVEIEYGESEGERTIVDIGSPGGITALFFQETVYPNWKRTGDLSHCDSTEVRLKGIPRRLHLETTSEIPKSQGSDPSLNILDNLMSQLAGRFYRIGTVLKEIPRAVAEMPGRKGLTVLDCGGESITALDYRFTNGPFLNGTENFAVFYDTGDDSPAISAHIEGISHYAGSFESGNDILLSLMGVEHLLIGAFSEERSALVEIREAPSTIHLITSGDLISYEGTDNGTPARIGSVEYRYRDSGLYFDVNVHDIPSSLSLIKGEEMVHVVSGDGAIGFIEVFTANSTAVRPIDLRERNFISARVRNDRSAVGLRINDFRSLVYNNGSNGYLELRTLKESNFYALIDDLDSGLDLEAAFAPLPSVTHIDIPSMIDAPTIEVPDILGIENISQYSEILMALSDIGRAPLALASGISEGLIRSIGRYSTGFSISWNLSNERDNLDLIISIRKYGSEEVKEAHWTHGIWIEQRGVGENSSLDGRIYLNGMPTSGSVNLSFSDRTIAVQMDFEGYRPDFDWMFLNTGGVQDRDIQVYLTELASEMDLDVDLEITTDLSIGGSMIVDMEIELVDPNGNPINLGPMVATLRKTSPILSIRQMYLPEVPAVFDLRAVIGEGVQADYSASSSIAYLYFKITKFLDGRWSQVYAIFHDLPKGFIVNIIPTRDFSVQKPFPLQGLPILEITTSSSGMDMFIDYDGTGFGQRGRYKIYADNVGNTSTYYRGDSYVIDSEGIGFLSLEVDRLPAMESFTVSSLSMLGSDIEHVEISASMGFGVFPVIDLDNGEGGSFQIKIKGEANLNDRTYKPDIYFITVRTRDILGFEIVSGVSVTRDTMAIEMERSDGGTVLPAPVLTLWAWVLGGVF